MKGREREEICHVMSVIGRAGDGAMESHLSIVVVDPEAALLRAIAVGGGG